MKKYSMFILGFVIGLCISESGFSQDEDLSKAKSLIESKEWDQAIKLLEHLIKFDSQNAEAYYMLGVSSGGAMWYSKMDSSFEKSLALSIKYEQKIHVFRSKLFSSAKSVIGSFIKKYDFYLYQAYRKDENKLINAHEYMEHVVQKDSLNAEACYFLGVTYAIKIDIEKMKALFDKCLQISPAYADKIRNFVKKAIEDARHQIKVDFQIQLMDYYTQIDPLNAKIFYYLGEAYRSIYDYDKMTVAFDKSLELSNKYKNDIQYIRSISTRETLESLALSKARKEEDNQKVMSGSLIGSGAKYTITHLISCLNFRLSDSTLVHSEKRSCIEIAMNKLSHLDEWKKRIPLTGLREHVAISSSGDCTIAFTDRLGRFYYQTIQTFDILGKQSSITFIDEGQSTLFKIIKKSQRKAEFIIPDRQGNVIIDYDEVVFDCECEIK